MSTQGEAPTGSESIGASGLQTFGSESTGLRHTVSEQVVLILTTLY
jgi:hypothetical protein